MSDYSERLQSKMTDERRDRMPASPYRVIGTIGTVSESVDPSPEPQEGSNAPQYFAAFAATLGNLAMGTTIGWSSPAGPLLARSRADGGFGLSDEQKSWVGCLMPAGALLGGQVGGVLMSRLGRKGTMIFGAAMFAISYLLLVVAPNVWLIYVGRFATGICTGVCSMVCPTYVAETATANKRGFLGACVQLMVTLGVMLVVVVGLSESWRWISISCLIVISVWIICLVLVPETPAHHLSKRKYREARESLEWLRGTIHVDQEYEEIQRSLESSSNVSAGIGDLFKSQNLNPFIISLWLMLGQQFSGMNAVMFYCVDIFEAAGTKMDSNIENIIVSAVQIGATVLSALVMDKAGRRLLLCLSSLIMIISIIVLGVFFYILDHNADQAHKLGLLPVVCLSLFVFGFSIGFGPIPWLMMSELFSPEVKSLASSLATTTNWTLAFLVTKFFTNLVTVLTEAGAFWFFGAFTILTLIYSFLFVPETKGKSLDEVQQIFRSGKPYFLDVGPWKLCARKNESDSEDTRNIIREEVY